MSIWLYAFDYVKIDSKRFHVLRSDKWTYSLYTQTHARIQIKIRLVIYTVIY